MVDSYRCELRDLIDSIYHGELGGRATQGQLHTAVWSVLPEHFADYLIGKGIRSEVSAYFRMKEASGLPKYPEVNAEGEHVQLILLSASEMEFLHRSYLDRADANTAQAEKVRDLCLGMHGVDLNAVRATA